MLMTLDISEVIMFKTITQRVVFIIGLVWLGYGVFGAMLEVVTGPEWANQPIRHVTGALITLVPTLILWHFTGVLKPVFDWFRGSKQ